MQNSGRKRGVASCIPCYTKKQKCNRRYPCNHCTHRRRPEECAYYSSQTAQVTSSPQQTANAQEVDLRSQYAPQQYDASRDDPSSLPTSDIESGLRSNYRASLVESFGYFEDSESNTMAIVRKMGLIDGGNDHEKGKVIPPQAHDAVRKALQRIPHRNILDILMQFFMTEVNWVDQLIHPPWFLPRYQDWLALGCLSSVAEVELGALILRICSYASLSLPCPSHTIDSIRGMSLADIRIVCDEAAEELAKICTEVDQKGSLLRVQHLCFSGLRFQSDGRNDAFWHALSDAIKVAQRIGIHRDTTPSMHGIDELEKEMRRRTFCNLYIWDSLLSRQLDCIPFLAGATSTDNTPQMHLVPEIGDLDSPDGFMERVLEARLADFWKISIPRQGVEYNVTEGEERYERFYGEFVSTLPPVFALQPNTEWDKRFPKLPMQRQLLHITIFESICWNFRPALLLDPSRSLALPAYKRVLLSSQKRTLAAAALTMLDKVSALHTLLGGSHTRFAGVIFPTFEAAVLLLCLCAGPDFTDNIEECSQGERQGALLRMGVVDVTRNRCKQAAHDALCRMRMLAEVSDMAEVGARTLERLVSGEMKRSPMAAELPVELLSCAPLPEPDADESRWLPYEHSEAFSLDDLLPIISTSAGYQS